VIVIVLVVLVVLVLAAVVWARVSAVRSEKRSVETYERALGVLGEVSKRTESTGFRILPHEQTGRPHVGTPVDEGGEEAPHGRTEASQPPQGPLVSSRLPPAGQPKLRFSVPVPPPVEGEDARAGADGRGDAAPSSRRPQGAGGDREARPPAFRRSGAAAGGNLRGTHQSGAARRRQVLARRAATGGAAAVAVVAVVIAAISLTGGGGHRPRKSTATTEHRGGSGRTTTTSTATTLPSTLKPTSVTATDVSFTAPSGQYTLAFTATGGACWIGIETSAGAAGPWRFAETLSAGQSATYAASGALVVRLGAPAYIGLQVNGLPAELPSGQQQAYNVDFTPATG